MPKEKVLAFRTIVQDVGADRGFLMAEGGYQSGALEAARLTNISLTSLRDLRETLAYELGTIRLDSLWARTDASRRRYWAIDKEDRIRLGLRADTGQFGYSGRIVVDAVDSILQTVRLAGYPIAYNQLWCALNLHNHDREAPPDGFEAIVCDSPNALFNVLDAELRDLEQRLETAEASLAQNLHSE